MSFFEHLTELRMRIIWSLIPAGVGLGIALYFTTTLMYSLSRHLKTELVFTAPTEAFWAFMTVAMSWASRDADHPVEMWAFVAAGLHKHERRHAAPFVIVGSLLFLSGGTFALFVTIPLAINFPGELPAGAGDQAHDHMSSYIDFIIKLTLAFRVVFEVPVMITLLSMLGVVTPQFLSKNRKYAILINFINVAILTPTPDMVNQTLMAGPSPSSTN